MKREILSYSMNRTIMSRAIVVLFVQRLKPEYQMQELIGTYVRQYLYHHVMNAHVTLNHRARYFGDIK